MCGKRISMRPGSFNFLSFAPALPLAGSAGVDEAPFLFGFSCVLYEMTMLEKMTSESDSVL